MSWTTPTTRATGFLVSAAVYNADLINNLLALGVDYSNHSPVLTASVTNPTLGAGALANGRYRQIGKLVHYYGRIHFGSSGANAGSGVYRISLPINWAAPIGNDVCGSAVFWDSSLGVFYLAVCKFNEVVATYFQMVTTSATSHVGAAIPIPWAENDELRWAITYEGV